MRRLSLISLYFTMVFFSQLSSANPHGNGYGRRLETRPARSSEADEVDAANLMARAVAGLGCDRAGEALRRMSNLLLSNVRLASQKPIGRPGMGGGWGSDRDRMREEMRARWAGHMRNPQFWKKVWDRLADAYRGCDLTCFDDGLAIGQISGAGYCAASVGVGGLTSPGFAYQPSLPLCQNALFVGCQSGYGQAVSSYNGCSTYTTGQFDSIFKEYQSQDCHVD